VTATFFIVSQLATEYPETIRRIAEQGHEIAAHTRTHSELVGLAPERQREEVVGAKADLEAVLDRPVQGFRAPTCQVNDRIYRLLTEAGYEYSSSVMPSVPIPGFYSHEYGFTTPTTIMSRETELTELPLSVNPYVRLPVSGAWLRLLGRTYTQRSIRQLLAQNRPVLTYSHPWEVAPLQDTDLPFRNRVRTGAWFTETFEQLLQFDADYCTVGELAERSSPDLRYAVTNN